MMIIQWKIWCGILLWISCVTSKPEDETPLLSDPTTANDTEVVENDSPTTVGYNEMGFRPMNITREEKFEPDPPPMVTHTHETKSPSLGISASTISWLEAIMLHRDVQWMTINIILLILWCVIAFGSLYRLLGLYFCTRLVYECMYLVVHLLVFLASTFNILLLTHLCYGEQGTFPLFLTLLMTHTPSLCIAIACLVISFRILALCEIPSCRMRILETRHVAWGLFGTLVFSFIGDIVVGITHNNGVLLSFRGILVVIYIACMFQFVLYKNRIYAYHEVIDGKIEDGSTSSETGRKLESCLIPWTKLIRIACIVGMFMCVFNYVLSMFFTVSNITLKMFWLVHLPLQILQMISIVHVTLGISTTLIDVEPGKNLLRLFMCPTICGKIRPVYSNRRFMYGTGNRPNHNSRPCIQRFEERSVPLNDEGCPSFTDPSIYRRLVTGNQMFFPNHEPYNGDLSPSANTDSKYFGLPYTVHEDSEEEHPPVSPTGKYPVMGCNGRIRQGSFRSLPNGSPRNRMQNSDRQHAQQYQLESFLPPSNGNIFQAPVHTPTSTNPPVNSTENCVKEIILENANLFRSQSQRCADRRRGPRVRPSIRTSAHPLFLKNSDPSSSHCPKTEDRILLNNSTSAAFPEVPNTPDHYSTLPASSYGKNIHTDYPYAAPLSPNNEEAPKACVAKYWDASPVLQRASVKHSAIPVECPVAPVLPEKPSVPEIIPEPAYTEPFYLETNVLENGKRSPAEFQIPPPPPINESFEVSTLPSPKRQSLKRNHSSVGYSDTSSVKLASDSGPGYDPNLKYPWYGTWGGRRSKRRPGEDTVFGQKMQKSSGSKGSLSSLYGRIRPRRIKTTPEPEAVELTTPPPPPPREEPEKIEEEPEEPLPQLEEKIDLAAEILKSSSILADFLASKSKEEVPEPSTNLLPLQATAEDTPVEGS